MYSNYIAVTVTLTLIIVANVSMFNTSQKMKKLSGINIYQINLFFQIFGVPKYWDKGNNDLGLGIQKLLYSEKRLIWY